MEGFDKIRDLNLAELGEKKDVEEEIPEEIEEGQQESLAERNEEEEESLESDLSEDSVPQKKEKMDDPVGKHYYVDADITETVLRKFLFGHSYRQPVSILITVMAILFPIIYIVKGSPQTPLAIMVAVVILIYYPLTIFMKAKKIKRTNKTFAERFHYMFDEKGCHLQLSEEAIDVDWKYFKKIMVLKSLVVIYTNRYNGYIVPTENMGEQKEEIIDFLREKIQK